MANKFQMKFVFLSLKNVSLIPENSSDPDELVHFATSCQDLHSLSIYICLLFSSQEKDNTFQTNRIFHKATYNNERMAHCIY